MKRNMVATLNNTIKAFFLLLFINNAHADFFHENEDVHCLALNIYYESGEESTAGKYAVGHVTLNRTHNTSYPDSVCGVVKQRAVVKRNNKRKTVCQFTWACKESLFNSENINKDLYEKSEKIAISVINKEVKDNTNGAIAFYNPEKVKVHPRWTYMYTLSARVGNHLFFKKPRK